MYAWHGRLGQKKDVIIYKLSIANSVEERILALQVSHAYMRSSSFH